MIVEEKKHDHKFSSGFRLIDNFFNCFSFHWANYKDKKSKETCLYKLDKIFANILIYPSSIIIVSDTSIKNNIAISILHVYYYGNGIKKTIYYVINITLTEIELFCY